ncbi:MAG: hypothetical protein ACLUJS_14930 [Anaerostipes hadrus]
MDGTICIAIDAIIEKIPGLNKIDFSIDNLQEKVGVLAEPIVIGGILGAIVGALAGYDFSSIPVRYQDVSRYGINA